jgi:carbamoyl-phosphate synthase large subunit
LLISKALGRGSVGGDKMRVLITSVGTTTSVNLIKEFKKKGDYVVGVDINPFGYTAGSCLVDKFYQIVWAVDEKYLYSLLKIIESEKIDVLIPINDIEVYIISQNTNRISCKCLIPDEKNINICRDKFVCSEKVAAIGVPVPEILSSGKEKMILRDRIGVGSKGIEIILKGAKIPEYRMEDKFLQKFISGEEYTVDILADKNGDPVYIVPRKRIEVKSGVATKVEIVNDDKLIHYSKMILEEIKLPGFSNIQFIKDGQGTCWFIEINYRFSGCGAATIAVSKNYIDKFKEFVNGAENNSCINEDVKWNAIVTRYYEECVYENSIS